MLVVFDLHLGGGGISMGLFTLSSWSFIRCLYRFEWISMCISISSCGLQAFRKRSGVILISWLLVIVGMILKFKVW